jgi:gamma-butyrobetaine dioxygenase
MQIQSVHPHENALVITWSDGTCGVYPYQFLRDNDPAGFHPQTRERQFDLLSVENRLAPRDVRVENAALVLEWQPSSCGRTVIGTDWLATHCPGRRAADPADVEAVTWGAEFVAALPRFEAAHIATDDKALCDWLVKTKRLGLSLIEGLERQENAGIAIGERVGFLRRTNFGVTFRVETKPDPNNLAYTSHALALHTDLPNQEVPPGFQFLHCVVNNAEGGGSVFADAFRIAERVRLADPGAFDLLSRVPIPYRFHDHEVDIRVHRPLIGLDERGRVSDVRYSAHLMDAFDMEPELMTDYYGAFRLFMAETRNPANIIRFKLEGGQMVVFDNRRVLHGRDAFDPSTGHRLLIGFYIDRGEFDSRIRIASRPS